MKTLKEKAGELILEIHRLFDENDANYRRLLEVLDSCRRQNESLIQENVRLRDRVEDLERRYVVVEPL